MQKIAAIDVGSNATRLSIMEISSTGVVVGTDQRRYPLRLGADVFAHGTISTANGQNLLDIFHDIAATFAARDVTRYRAVATAAMREAKNSKSLLERIRHHSGLALEIVTGEEESRLAKDALTRAFGAVRAGTVLIDLGGGSLEITWAKGKVARSLPFGTVRLLNAYPALARPLTKGELEVLRKAIFLELRQHIRAPARADTAIGTGGNLGALVQILPREGVGLPAIDLERLPELALRLAAMDLEERVSTFGVRSDRADVLLPAVLVLWGLVELFHCHTLVVPGTGLRESILHQLVSPPNVRLALQGVLRRFGCKVTEAERLANVARELFWGLAPVHQLWAPALAALEACAYLKDLGRLIDPLAPLPHTLYLLENLAGLELEELSRHVAWHALAHSGPGVVGSDAPPIAAADARVAHLHAALLGLAAAICALKPRAQPRVDLMSNPIRIDVGLPRPLPSTRPVLALAQLLDRGVVVE